jgi:hypothetical protein
MPNYRVFQLFVKTFAVITRHFSPIAFNVDSPVLLLSVWDSKVAQFKRLPTALRMA